MHTSILCLAKTLAMSNVPVVSCVKIGIERAHKGEDRGQVRNKVGAGRALTRQCEKRMHNNANTFKKVPCWQR